MDKKMLVQKYRGVVRFLCGVYNAPSVWLSGPGEKGTG